MKNDDLKNKPSEDLKSELKMIQIVTWALTGILILLVSVCIYGLITKEANSTFIASIAVAISCGAILPVQFSSMKKIKNELKLRENTF